MKTLIALVLLSAVASANVGNGAQYLTKSHGIVTVTTTVHYTTNTATVTYSDAGGTSLAVGGTPGGGNSVSNAGEGTTHGTDPEGNSTTGGTYRINKHGKLQGKNKKGKWRNLKEKPKEAGETQADSQSYEGPWHIICISPKYPSGVPTTQLPVTMFDDGGGSGGHGTIPFKKAQL